MGINDWFFYAGIYLAGAILIGILLSKIIEYPILRIRDRYFPPVSSAVN
jgi:glycerol-3-phosphate acyltransferase PlsY